MLILEKTSFCHLTTSHASDLLEFTDWEGQVHELSYKDYCDNLRWFPCPMERVMDQKEAANAFDVLVSSDANVVFN